MKAIIFGVNSQDGFYLSKICKERAIEVIGVSRSKGEWVEGSVSDKDFTEQLIKHIKPTYIFHLAANSTTRHEVLFENNATINNGTLYILESVKQFSPHTKVFITGSGLQFVNNGKPIKETDEFEGSSAYAVARIQSVYAARYYRSIGVKTYVGYLFHHESPMRKGNHLSKFIADSVKKIKMGELTNIEIGNTSVMKEWGFAGDIAKGIFTLVSQDSVFEATIGTGKAYSIADWLGACFGLAELDWHQFVIEKSTTFSPEYHLLFSDCATINSLGWKAETSFNALAKMMMA